MSQIDQYIHEIEQELTEDRKGKVKSEEVGTVKRVTDGVAVLTGLDNVSFGEIVEFASGVQGMVIDLTSEVGVVILGNYLQIEAGETVKATGRTLSVGVSEDIIGRVVDPLMKPQDGGDDIKADKYYPMEKVAAGVVHRKSVTVPVQTGIMAIDALTAIGRGQRELIIGDRGTGKTSLALDTILNQKGQDMICIYCGIGQKSSKIAAVVELLRSHGALDYSIVVSASASDPVTLQYLAPYAATAVGEYFMDQGKDVLIVYDDLSKHAWAYRQVSLILRRPAGREAYPGDVFYLHSRLLERSVRLNEANGGGSITALPIIETLAGDVSAYIPTNVISITDGNIILDADLFNAGIRPAVNVGLSVSRVGGNAQTKAMKQVAGKLKLDLAQYREMAAFSQFESDLDEETKKFLNRGARMTQLLKQGLHHTYSLADQVALMWAGGNGYIDTLDINKVGDFVDKLLKDLHAKGTEWIKRINKNKKLEKEDEEELRKIVESVVAGIQE
jgi:F-type H+-transporting ATPase subunit alpha